MHLAHRSGRRSIAFALLAAALLAGCTSADDSTPTATATATVEMTASPSSTATETPAPTETGAPEDPLAFPTVVPTDVPGFSAHTDSNNGDPYRFFATYPELDDYPLLGETMHEAVERERADFDALGLESSGPVEISLNIGFDFLVASGDVLGVRLSTYAFYGANGGETADVYWFDLRDNTVGDARKLFADDAAIEAIGQRLSDRLTTDYAQSVFPEEFPKVFGPDAEDYPTMGFDPDGNLLVEFDEATIGPASLGNLTIAIPADEVDPYLSEYGRRARDETRSPSGPLVLPTTTAVPPTMTPPLAGGVDCAAVACIALTFDDGPSRYTDSLLDTLAAAGVHATFFVVGTNARFQPAILARMAAEGHQVGNHTFDHKDLTTLGRDQIRDEWASTAEIITDATGVPPVLFRPPYGAVNDTVRDVVDAPFILWSVDPRDWADHDVDLVTARVLDAARTGDIVLLHDIHETTVEAVPGIIAGLQQRGFTLVTVDTLLGGSLEAGHSYSRR